MDRIKLLQFTKIIKAGGQLREFNFRKSYGPSGDCVFIDVADVRGERYYIRFMKSNDRWEIKPGQFPIWIQEVVAQIEQAINESN